jgi:hypothetical protein
MKRAAPGHGTELDRFLDDHSGTAVAKAAIRLNAH